MYVERHDHLPRRHRRGVLALLALPLLLVAVLSLPFLLEDLVPRLALAVDGDPATVVPGP